MAQVYQLVSSEISSQKSATTITTDIKDYEVYLQSAEQSDVTVDDIKNLTFTYKDNDGSEKEIPLSDICTISQEQTLSTIHRDAQTRYITVSGAVDENHNVTLLSDKIKSKINKLSIPDGYSIDMEGEDETINESMKSAWTYACACSDIYLSYHGGAVPVIAFTVYYHVLYTSCVYRRLYSSFHHGK